MIQKYTCIIQKSTFGHSNYYSLKFYASAMSGAGINPQPVKKLRGSAIRVENVRDGRITRRRKDGPMAEKTGRMRVEQKYSLNVKEVRLIKPTSAGAALTSVALPRFPHPQPLCVCRSAAPVGMRDRLLPAGFGFSSDYRNTEHTMQRLHFVRSALLAVKRIFRETNRCSRKSQFT